jgi:hypothetical protein
MRPRRIASSRPRPVRASVRATRRKSGLWRAFGGDLDLEDHLLGGNDAAAGGVTAFLRHLLVLELDAGHAGRLVALARCGAR